MFSWCAGVAGEGGGHLGSGSSVRRLHGWHDPSPASTGGLPHLLPLRRKGSGPLHHVLDSLAICSLDREPITRPVPQETHVRGGS